MRQITHKRRSRPRVVIPKTFTRGMELVVLTRERYEQEVRRGKEIAATLQAIAEGERAHREGRTLAASSLEEALKRHATRAR